MVEAFAQGKGDAAAYWHAAVVSLLETRPGDPAGLLVEIAFTALIALGVLAAAARLWWAPYRLRLPRSRRLATRILN